MSGSVVTLQGASACDVFWTPAGATTLGANTTFEGTVIDDAGVTVGAVAQWTGRALAFGGTVTTDTDTITNTCTVAPASLRVIKNVQNVGSSTATSSDFVLHVKSGGSDVPGSPSFGTTSPGTLYILWPGIFGVSELPNILYTQIFNGDCNASGGVTLGAGENKTCSITNVGIASPTTTATTTEQATTTPTVSTTTTEVATTTTIVTHRSGGNSASRLSNSSSAAILPVSGEVLGASQVSPQVAAISLPLGAPNTGMGGAQNEPNDVVPALALLLVLIGAIHFSRIKRV